MVAVGDVIYIYDATVTPPKKKLLVCVIELDSVYFRINSKGHWPGSLAITAENNEFLKHDSFVECGSPLDVYEGEIEESLRVRDNPVGYLSKGDIVRLINHIPTVYQLSPRNKQQIITSLQALLQSIENED